MSKALELFQKAFSGPRDKRSQEYKDGVLAALRFRFKETSTCQCPHPVGTASADAYFSGLEEGHFLWRKYLATLDAENKGDSNG